MSKSQRNSPPIPSNAESPTSQLASSVTAKDQPDKKLAAWLDEQAKKLRSLEAKGHRLKLNFLQNAKEQGEVFLLVKERLSATSISFASWVPDNIDIAYSTALLWIDVAQHWDLVKERFADSNPLELTIRAVRDFIRDERQKQGRGKPGSGKRKPTTGTVPDAVEAADDQVHESVEVDSVESVEEAAPDTARWEQMASEAEAEAAEGEDADHPKAGPALYKVLVMVFSDGDQDTIRQALSNWSPISIKPTTTKQLRSVSVHARPKDIGTLLQRLGKVLEGDQPMKVRVSIEL